MNAYTLILAFAVVGVSCLVAAQDEAPLGTIKMEPECGRAGGMCLLAEDCPEGMLSATKGLCPQQQNMGVECCHGLSVRERRCGARGGMCRSKCGRQLLLDADDCPAGTSCCALV